MSFGKVLAQYSRLLPVVAKEAFGDFTLPVRIILADDGSAEWGIDGKELFNGLGALKSGEWELDGEYLLITLGAKGFFLSPPDPIIYKITSFTGKKLVLRLRDESGDEYREQDFFRKSFLEESDPRWKKVFKR